jgi:hypothetical protein
MGTRVSANAVPNLNKNIFAKIEVEAVHETLSIAASRTLTGRRSEPTIRRSGSRKDPPQNPAVGAFPVLPQPGGCSTAAHRRTNVVGQMPHEYAATQSTAETRAAA